MPLRIPRPELETLGIEGALAVSETLTRLTEKPVRLDVIGTEVINPAELQKELGTAAEKGYLFRQQIPGLGEAFLALTAQEALIMAQFLLGKEHHELEALSGEALSALSETMNITANSFVTVLSKTKPLAAGLLAPPERIRESAQLATLFAGLPSPVLAFKTTMTVAQKDLILSFLLLLKNVTADPI